MLRALVSHSHLLSENIKHSISNQQLLADILYFDPITEQFQVMEQTMSIGRSNHLIFALEEFPTGVCSAAKAT